MKPSPAVFKKGSFAGAQDDGKARDDGNAQDGEGESGADDGFRTRDLELGKLALYQLSYVRVR